MKKEKKAELTELIEENIQFLKEIEDSIDFEYFRNKALEHIEEFMWSNDVKQCDILRTLLKVDKDSILINKITLSN